MKRRTSGAGWKLDWVCNLELLHQHYDHPVIYFIVCKPTRIGYIGSTQRLHDRIKNHFGDLALGKHANRAMQAAWNEYGVDNFDWGVVEVCAVKDLLQREQYWINRYPKARLFNALADVRNVRRTNRVNADFEVKNHESA